jgi:hypothetical protein
VEHGRRERERRWRGRRRWGRALHRPAVEVAVAAARRALERRRVGDVGPLGRHEFPAAVHGMPAQARRVVLKALPVHRLRDHRRRHGRRLHLLCGGAVREHDRLVRLGVHGLHAARLDGDQQRHGRRDYP